MGRRARCRGRSLEKPQVAQFGRDHGPFGVVGLDERQAKAATSYLRFTRIAGTSSSVGTSSSTATMKVTAKELYLRAAASASAKVLVTMKGGASVQLLSKGTTWHKVKYNGKTGYAAARYLQ